MLELQVSGMTCNHCVRAVSDALRSVDPTARVDVDLNANRIRVESSAATEPLVAAVTEAGYDVLKVNKA